MYLVFLGAPGVGKGTQAEKVAAHFGIAKISTGDLLREAVRAQTALGRDAKAFMDQGKLVPDSVVIGLVRDKLSDASCGNGFVLDGFPRTVPQAEELGAVLSQRNIRLDGVINFQVSREDIVNRLSGRRSCPKCQATFHTEFAPPQKSDICDRCGEKLAQRNDDKRDAIEMRLKVYEEQTSPLIQYYDQKGLLTHLDGAGPVDGVHQRLTKVLAPYRCV